MTQGQGLARGCARCSMASSSVSRYAALWGYPSLFAPLARRDWSRTRRPSAPPTRCRRAQVLGGRCRTGSADGLAPRRHVCAGHAENLRLRAKCLAASTRRSGRGKIHARTGRRTACTPPLRAYRLAHSPPSSEGERGSGRWTLMSMLEESGAVWGKVPSQCNTGYGHECRLFAINPLPPPGIVVGAVHGRPVGALGRPPGAPPGPPGSARWLPGTAYV